MLPSRTLGRNGPVVSALGLGCMGMSAFYGGRDEGESLRTLARAVELGVTFFDTADVYGHGGNETLVGRALKPHRDHVLIATKFANTWNAAGERTGISGEPSYVQSACEASLTRLGLDVIDLYYQHRVDPRTPIEDTVGAMARLVEQGKVRHLGLSEAAPATIRRAHATHPIAALQSEYSLWSRDPEGTVLPTLRELGIALIPYSPLGRGMLTGALAAPDALDPDDWRRSSPRFQADAFSQNLTLVENIRQLAVKKGCTPAQLALAWVLAQGDDIIPIPGTKKVRYLEENLAAAEVKLSPNELREIDQAMPAGLVAGDRYTPEGMRALNG